MNYKRTNSRPKCFAKRSTFAARYEFSIKLVWSIDENHLIVNIDEWSVDRNWITNYSWGKKAVVLNIRTLSL